MITAQHNSSVVTEFCTSQNNHIQNARPPSWPRPPWRRQEWPFVCNMKVGSYMMLSETAVTPCLACQIDRNGHGASAVKTFVKAGGNSCLWQAFYVCTYVQSRFMESQTLQQQ